MFVFPAVPHIEVEPTAVRADLRTEPDIIAFLKARE